MLRRLARRALFFLALGAVTTVGVAWLCGWLVRFDPATHHETSSRPPVNGSPWCAMALFQKSGAAHTWVRRLDRAEYDEEFAQHETAAFDDLWRRWGGEPAWWWLAPQSIDSFCVEREPLTDFQFAARGWPMLSMWTALNDATVDDGIDLGWAHLPGTFATTRRVLPFRPIVIGFAVDTIFYASILWALFALPGAAKRRWRRGRNLCESCAYPIGTSPVCTECGKPFTRKGA